MIPRSFRRSSPSKVGHHVMLVRYVATCCAWMARHPRCVWNNRCMWAGHKRLTQRVAVAVSRHASQVKRQIVVFPGDAQTFSEHMQRCAACLGVGSCSVLMRQGVSPQRPVLPIQGLQPREYGAAACSSPRGCHCVCDCVRTPRLSARRPVLACSPASLAGRHACTKACTAAFPILRMWARLAWRLLFPRPAAWGVAYVTWPQSWPRFTKLFRTALRRSWTHPRWPRTCPLRWWGSARGVLCSGP